jgi:hypothetical protein
MLPRLLDPENKHDFVWADSAYSGECFADLWKVDKKDWTGENRGLVGTQESDV